MITNNVLSLPLDCLRKKYRPSLKNDMPPRDKDVGDCCRCKSGHPRDAEIFPQNCNNGNNLGQEVNKLSDGLAAIQAQLKNLGREIKKVNEKVYAAQVGYEQWEYRAAALGFYQRNNANPSYQERRQYMEETLSKFIGESEKRHKENSNLIKKIRASTDVAIRNQGAPIKTLEIQIGQMSKITLRVREEKIVFKSVKPASSLIKTVYMLSLRERMKLDLEARVMGETLVLNRSLDPFFGDYMGLNDLNVPLELRKDQVNDLMPTIKEDFAVLEDMDAYRNEGMSDVIFGEPILREVGINAKRFEGMITIYNGNEEVTYQMMRSHMRFKHHTNEQCNKIPPLLKVSEEDMMNGSRTRTKSSRVSTGGLELKTRICSRCEDRRMAHTRAH
ncbi:hypothetical protein Tco_1137295 [Tanacetum coccineum]